MHFERHYSLYGGVVQGGIYSDQIYESLFNFPIIASLVENSSRKGLELAVLHTKSRVAGMMFFNSQRFVFSILVAFLLSTSPDIWASTWYGQLLGGQPEPAPYSDQQVGNQDLQTVYAELRRRGFSTIEMASAGGSLYVSLRHERISNGDRALGRAARVLTYGSPSDFDSLIICLKSDIGLCQQCLSFDRNKLERYFDRLITKYQLQSHASPVACGGNQEVGDALNKKAEVVPADGAVQVIEQTTDGRREGYLDADLLAGYSLYHSNSLTVTLNPFDFANVVNDRDGEFYVDAFSSLSFKQWISDGLFAAGRGMMRWSAPDHPSASDSELPHVISDIDLYRDENPLIVDQLYLSYSRQLSDRWFFNSTVGYQHEMFAGIASQWLWHQVLPNTSVDLRVEWLKQRDFDSPYSLSGDELVSSTLGIHWASQDVRWINTAKVYAGQFLAEDHGVRAEIGHRFKNGVEISFWYGATDSGDYDGSEGGFPLKARGLQFTVPLNFFGRKDTHKVYSAEYMSTVRDSAQLLHKPVDLVDSISDGGFSGRASLRNFGQ